MPGVKALYQELCSTASRDPTFLTDRLEVLAAIGLYPKKAVAEKNNNLGVRARLRREQLVGGKGPLPADALTELEQARENANLLRRLQYARELNRADHIKLGLAPPGVGLLPPGEADVFAGRA